MAIEKRVRNEIIAKLYHHVPVSEILKEYNVDRTTVYRWKKKVEKELEGRAKERQDAENETVVENATVSKENATKLQKQAFPPIEPISLDNLADHALLGLWDGLTTIKEGLERVRYIEGNATRESLTVSYLKEYRQYIALAGRWGGLDNKVASDNPILTAFTEALKGIEVGKNE